MKKTKRLTDILLSLIHIFSSYVESQGDYCTGFDYVRPYAENEYLVCAKIGEYEWEAEYIVEVNGSDAWVIGRLDGGVFRPV